MFSGLVMGTRRVISVRAGLGGGRLLTLRSAAGARGFRPGSSVAVDGVCLTVERLHGGRLHFYVSPETLRKTTLGTLKPGDKVNLETSLRWGEPLGGHLVQGHVEGTATVSQFRKRGDSREMWVSFPGALRRWLVPQGSVALAGISLTVARMKGNRAALASVPQTLRRTNLGVTKTGKRLNVETDLMLRASGLRKSKR